MSTIYEQEIQNKIKRYYRIREAAQLFALSEKTIRRWISEKSIKAVRIGRSIRIPLNEIERMVQSVN